MAFLVNGLSYFVLCAVAWRIPPPAGDRGTREPMSHAMRTGVRFVRHSPALLKVFLVSGLFALTSANLQALLAPVADARHLGAQGYGLMFSCFGVGALVGALTTRRLSMATRRLGAQTVSITLFGLANLAFALAPGALLAALSIAVAGAAWVITFATLNTAVQLGVPTWVRGRVLSIYMMAFTGAMPLGSLLSGGLGGAIGPGSAVAFMSLSVIAVAVATAALRLPSGSGQELATAPDDWPKPTHAPSVPGGPVAVVVSWVVESDDREDFVVAMRSVRRSRLRSGAVRWTLYDDHEHPGRLVELFEVPDWDEHLRQHGRLDREAISSLRRAREFHVGGAAPDVQHLIGVDVGRPPGTGPLRRPRDQRTVTSTGGLRDDTGS
jgi:hypothetical protein